METSSKNGHFLALCSLTRKKLEYKIENSRNIIQILCIYWSGFIQNSILQMLLLELKKSVKYYGFYKQNTVSRSFVSTLKFKHLSVVICQHCVQNDINYNFY